MNEILNRQHSNSFCAQVAFARAKGKSESPVFILNSKLGLVRAKVNISY
jgi:hypothetical protein